MLSIKYTTLLTISALNLCLHTLLRPGQKLPLSLLIVLTITLGPGIKSIHANTSIDNQQEPIFPLPLTVNVNTRKAELGELLFFDTRLSRSDAISCSTCHQLDAGGDDNMALGTTISGDNNVIHTPTIFNAKYNFRQNWNGSSKTLVDQVNAVVESHQVFDSQWHDIITKLSGDNNLKKKFTDVYKDGLTQNNIIDAIVEFEKTLVTPNARFDRYLRGEKDVLTKNELRGYFTFKKLGCIACHQGINIGGNLYQKFGVFYNYFAERGNIKKPDYGRMNITNRQIDAFVFKVPSLRNIAVTAPYLHDGSAATLEQAITIMGKTQLGRTLTRKEIFLIKAFLNTLTGEYKNKPLDSNP